MKCVCGYEHECGLDKDGIYRDNLVGDQAFKRLFHITDDDDNEVKVFACPKCGTLKVGDRWY